MIYLQLLWEFFKVGLFAVGGGMAAVPFLYNLAGKYPWFSAHEVADMIALAECTPGPLAINMATYAGYQAAGVGGSILASTAIIIPSLLISLIVSRFIAHYSNSTYVKWAFGGLRPAVAGLISYITFGLISLALMSGTIDFPLNIDFKALALFAAMLIVIFVLKKHPVIYIAVGALFGIILKL